MHYGSFGSVVRLYASLNRQVLIRTEALARWTNGAVVNGKPFKRFPAAGNVSHQRAEAAL